MKRMKSFMVIFTLSLIVFGIDSPGIFKPLVDEPIIGGHHIVKGD